MKATGCMGSLVPFYQLECKYLTLTLAEQCSVIRAEADPDSQASRAPV